MNPTSLEYLYQNAPPVPDRAPSTSRGEGGSSGFDDHLNQATSSALDIVQTPSRSDSRPRYAPVNRSSSESDESNQSNSATRPSDSKPPQKDTPDRDSNAAAKAGSAADAPHAASRQDNKHDDRRDKDKTEDEDATSAAGAAQAAQAAPDGAAKSTDQPSKDAKQSAVEGAKDKATADELSKVPATNADAAAAGMAKTDAKATDATAELKAGVEADKTGTDDVAVTKQNVEAKTGKAEPIARSVKATAKSNATNTTEAKADLAKDSTQTAKSGESAAAESPASAGKDETDASQLSTKTATELKAASETDQHHSDKDATSSTAPTPAATPMEATNNATAVAAVVAPNAIAAVADKSNDADDSAAKPVSAKSEVAAGALGRAFQKDLGASSKTSATSESSSVDVTRFVSRVAKAVQAASDRDGVVQLRLSPPELGSLKIQLTVKDGVMSAALEADNSNARQMLLDHLPALRDRLAGQNIRVDRFDVDVKQENNGGQANPRGSNQNPYQQQSQQPGPRRSTTKTPQVSESAPVEPATVAPRINVSGINLVI